MFAQVALPIPLRSLFTYSLPPDCCAAPGTLVLVPVGKTRQVGILWTITAQPAYSGEIRPIVELLEERPLLNDELRHLLEWIAHYYLAPIGSVLAAAMPGHLRFQKRRRVCWNNLPIPEKLPAPLLPLAQWLQQKKALSEETLAGKIARPLLKQQLQQLLRLDLIRLEEHWHGRQESSASESNPNILPSADPPNLTAEQAQQAQIIEEALQQRCYHPFLLHGITGSGKTELYLRAVEQVLLLGRQALLLVPEIALTPQLIERYQARFQATLAVFHSRLSEAQRFNFWQQIRDGRARVVIGARSAIFAPFADLGLIVVDEEHDSSYKQEGGVPYQGRDMAVVRARQAKAVLILGSATPSLESLANARHGRYTLLTLTQRATGANLPSVEMVHTAEAIRQQQMRFGDLLSPTLRQALLDTLAAGQQALLFLNRRGFAPSLLCRRCGHAIQCPHCSVTLTLHKAKQLLLCHYCDFRQNLQDVCPACGQLSLFAFGPGTERLHEELSHFLPNARIARLDRDTVSSGLLDLENTLRAFRDGQLDLLIGTQMVAKGHHFPGLALVGVVQAETTLCQPDFRAAERTFQLLTQVAGRAGREEGSPGRVLVQSFDPSHYALQAVLSHDVHGFVNTEMAYRQEAGYPPFHRLAMLRFSCAALQEGNDFSDLLKAHLPSFDQVQLLGPAPAPLFKLRNCYRWQLLIKELKTGQLHRALHALLPLVLSLANPRIRLDWDVDPYSFV
ncbi:MAG: primosomal protein N' [Magnetococcales bacterium]|nr:primosomal protein N' [Magnetococcales bacterium]MBF0114794.1 primosomal protein N' [Magnetococcales bacterium]